MATELPTWLQTYPFVTAALIILISAVESLLVVGLFVPGTALLLALGALVGTGHLPLWPTLLCAAAGSMLGDTTSFLIGRYFRERLPAAWPFRRYPRLWRSGQSYFDRQGVKAVLLGRYIGVMRPIVPAVAGATGMPAWWFVAVDALACLTWVPLNLLPGILLGTSFTLATEVGSHLVMLVTLLVAVLWFSFYLSTRLFRYLWPDVERAITGLLRRSRRYRPLQALAALLDPGRPELGGLFLLTALLTVLALAAITLAVWATGGLPTTLDTVTVQLVDALRSPRVDIIALWLGYLGTWPVFVPVLVFGGAVLVWRGQATATWHWLAAPLPNLVLAAAITGLLPILPAIGPIELSARNHSAIAAAVYLFLAARIAAEPHSIQSRVAYPALIAAVGLMLLARVYLGLEWPTVMLLELALMGLWLAALEVAYRHHSQDARPVSAHLLVAVALAVLLGLAYQGWQRAPHDLAVLTAERAPPYRTIDGGQWWRDRWQELPASVSDLQQRRTAFALQWMGDPPAIEQHLFSHGWRRATALSGESLLRMLTDDPPVTDLPLLPRVHDARYPYLMMVRPLAAERQRVIYLWDSGLRASPGHLPVSLGVIFEQRRGSLLGLLWYPRSIRPLPAGATLLDPLGDRWQGQLRRRPQGGRVQLIRPAEPVTVRPGPGQRP